MRKFIFTYNAEYDKYTGNEIREAIILFLHHNGAKRIKQHLETTFVFDSDKIIDNWLQLIKTKLEGKNNVLDGGFYLLNQVAYINDEYRIKVKSNPDLQEFVDDVLDE